MRMWGPAQAVDEAPRPPALPPEPPTVSSAWSSLGESGRCPAGPWGGKGGPLPQGSMRSAFSVLTGWPGEGQQRVCPVGLLCCPHRLQAPPALCRCICRNQSLTEDRVLAFAGSRTALQQVAPSYYLPLAFGPCGRSLGPRAGSLGTEGEQALPGVCPDALVLELPLPPAPQPPFLSHVWPSSPVSVRRSWALGTLRSWNSPSIPFQSRLRLRPAAPTDLYLCLRWTLLTPAHPSASPGSCACPLSRAGPSGWVPPSRPPL